MKIEVVKIDEVTKKVTISRDGKEKILSSFEKARVYLAKCFNKGEITLEEGVAEFEKIPKDDEYYETVKRLLIPTRDEVVILFKGQ